MSTHPLPTPVNDPGDSLRWEQHLAVVRLCRTHLREPSALLDDGTTLSLVFTPDLTAPEEAILDRIIGTVKLRLGLTPDDFEAIRAEVPTLRAYYLAPNPTAAQTVTATKSIIAVLRAILRD